MEELEQEPSTAFEREAMCQDAGAFCLSLNNLAALKDLLQQVGGMGCGGGGHPPAFLEFSLDLRLFLCCLPAGGQESSERGRMWRTALPHPDALGLAASASGREKRLCSVHGGLQSQHHGRCKRLGSLPGYEGPAGFWGSRSSTLPYFPIERLYVK